MKYEVIEPIVEKARAYIPGEVIELSEFEAHRHGKKLKQHIPRESKMMPEGRNKMMRKGKTK